MIIYYNLETKEIERTEENTLVPILPANKTLEEKKEFYKKQNIGFVAIPQELGSYIDNYVLCFNEYEDFIGLELKK